MPQVDMAQPCTPTVVALTDLDTSARGIEGHSLLGARHAVKSRWGDLSRSHRNG
jgi:hypothetical protein